MTKLDEAELVELICIQKTESELGGRPLSLHQSTWHGETGALARKRLITWRKGSAAWGPSFREVGITPAGADALDGYSVEDRERVYETYLAGHRGAEAV
jgi:hypothetical protein